jgi:hypothetical protein
MARPVPLRLGEISLRQPNLKSCALAFRRFDRKRNAVFIVEPARVLVS